MMIHVLLFSATALFVVGIIRQFWTAKKAGVVSAVVHSATIWAGLLTLAVIPVAHANWVPWPAVVLCPVIAFALATLFLKCSSYVIRNLVWQFSPLVTAGILPAGWLAALIGASWLAWNASVSAMPLILRQAEQRGQAIEAARDGMHTKLVSMQGSIAQFQIPPVQADSPYEQIRTSAIQLVELADTLIRQHADLVAYHDQYLRELEDAPELFLAASRVWRDYAAEDRALGLNDVGNGYEAMADLWQAYAEAIDESDQDPFSIQELDAVMVFIRRARLMLERVATSTPLDTAADFLDRKSQLEANMRLFVQRFDELRHAIQTLTQQIREIDHGDEGTDRQTLDVNREVSTSKQTIPLITPSALAEMASPSK